MDAAAEVGGWRDSKALVVPGIAEQSLRYVLGVPKNPQRIGRRHTDAGGQLGSLVFR